MRAYLTLALILSVGTKANAAETPIFQPSPAFGNAQAKANERLYHSRNAFFRSVRDMATWDFGWLAQNPNWVVAEIAPSVIPQHMIVKETQPRTFFQLETNVPPYSGRDVAPATVWDGALVVLKPLGTTPVKPVWPYRYARVFNGDSIKPDAIGTEAHENYSPFIHAPVDSQRRNLAFCSIPETIQNVQTSNTESTLNPKYHRAHMLSEDSLPWVIPARTFYETNPDFFSSEKAEVNRTRLVEMLDDPNPFLFAAAVRTLSQSSHCDSEFIAKKLLALDKFRQAVFMYSTLLYSRSPKALGKIGLAIGDAKNKEQLEGLILGSEQGDRTWRECVMLDPELEKIEYAGMMVSPSVTSPKIPTILRYSLGSMIEMYDRQRAFGVVTENDSYLFGLTTRAIQKHFPETLVQVK